MRKIPRRDIADGKNNFNTVKKLFFIQRVLGNFKERQKKLVREINAQRLSMLLWIGKLCRVPPQMWSYRQSMAAKERD